MRETVLKWGSRSSTWLSILIAFPIIDYVLRKFLPIPVLPSLWDKALLVVLLLFTFFAYLQTARKLPSIKHPFLAFIVYGIGLMVIDMTNWAASFEGFRSVYQYMSAFFIGFYLLADHKQLANLLKMLSLVGFITGLYGVAQVVLGVETPMGWVQEGEATTTRAFSFVTSPNVLGSYMALVAPVSVGLALYTSNKKERLLWILVALTTLLALLLTGSRGAWFALAAALFACFYLWKKRWAGYLVLAGIIGVLGLYFLVPDTVPIVGTIKNRIFTLFTADYMEASSKAGRLQRWLTAYDRMRVEPLFGVGLGHHGGAVASRRFGTIYTDSYLFKSLAELGLIGLSMFIGLILMTFRYGVKVARSLTGKPEFFLTLGLLGGMIAVALHNVAENIFEVPFMSLQFWLFGGIFAALYADLTNEKRG
ncbi:O-antigen ligase family protein [Brevibacillus ruminantium]|uniref:O-antigen ligase family protein n=1 Tax=Brevibacillus ruminantium TaxID=2950604 RepID=A0ABY4WBZ5_9BACL|nr:O-antigen ligase family protein [Brevibacillus ruminantium]USG64259.1 O-antigen ligase family protein [Brevibacillus ruminantium]